MPDDPPKSGRPSRTLAVWLVGALVGAITLWPRHRSLSSSGVESPWCLGCGVLPLADFLLNVALFLPVGLALGRAAAKWWKAVAVGCALSLAIELLQVAVPGRDPSVRDLLANSLGTALGTLSWNGRTRLLRPTPKSALVVGIVAALAAATVLVASSALMQPSTPAGLYFGQWAPRFRQRAFFDGHLFHASLTGKMLPQGPESDSGRMQRELAGGALLLEARLLPGNATWAFAPIAAVVDDQRREIAALGQTGRDAVFRARTLASDFGLATPAVRIREGFGSPADTTLVRGERMNGSIRLSVRDPRGAREAALRLSPGLGWATLQPGERPVGGEGAWVSAAWLVLLTLPGAFWLARSGRSGAIASYIMLLAIALLTIPAMRGAALAPWWELLGASGGVLAGWRLGRR